MYNLYLVCTRHQECGYCNSFELYDIIKKVKPEVIFEELSYAHFDESYNQKRLITLETNAIKDYLQIYQVKQFPVDTYPRPISYDDDVERMNKKIINHRSSEAYSLRILLENQYQLMSQYGFAFLNSDQNNELMDKINIIKERILNIINDEDLFRIHRLEKEVIEKREYEIIANIYKFSRDNRYDTALMFIGTGHRKSIFKLIEKFEMQEKLKLNWILNH